MRLIFPHYTLLSGSETVASIGRQDHTFLQTAETLRPRIPQFESVSCPAGVGSSAKRMHAARNGGESLGSAKKVERSPPDLQPGREPCLPRKSSPAISLGRCKVVNFSRFSSFWPIALPQTGTCEIIETVNLASRFQQYFGDDPLCRRKIPFLLEREVQPIAAIWHLFVQQFCWG